MGIEDIIADLAFFIRVGAVYNDESLRGALAIVRKYQKIQEIHKKWFCDYTSAEAYTKISEVLEDGKDNC